MKKEQYKSRIFVVSGPSGCGKTTMIDKMLEDKVIDDLFVRVVTATTREPRDGEVDGRDYFFISKEEFKAKEAEGFFIETKEYNSNWYGTPRFYVERAKDEFKNVLFCIEVDGALKIKEYYPKDAVLVFIFPPSVEELTKRLSGRGTENEEIVKKRLKIAEKELEYCIHYDYGIVNDNLMKAVDDLRTVILAERLKL